MAEANEFGAGYYLQPLTGKMLDAAFKRSVRAQGQNLRDLLDNLEEDGLLDESGGPHRGGRLSRSPSGRWVRDGRITSG